MTKLQNSTQSCSAFVLSSKFRIASIFKSSVKENTDSNKTLGCVHDISLHKTSFVIVTVY
jgi:hypothetical protein